MKKSVIFTIVFILFVFTATPLIAQDLIIYPAQGQSEEQTEKEKFECYTWAKKETGFDPMQTPTATRPPPKKEDPQGGVAKGAVVGGAGGAIAGGILGGKKGAGTGALIGAGGGALIGGMRRSNQRDREEKARQDWEREQANAYHQKRSAYNRAYGACLEGRGYTVK
ncbi:MAG: hypothetical protein JRF72_22850 [Deltaproteobacteria bacterium]|jgi:hypothetical protein|nr:hypothetical protein [Deltaproteobacteria bacterium]